MDDRYLSPISATVRRFIDPRAEFIDVPPTTVAQCAQNHGAIPYDIKDVAFGRVGDRCSFDAIAKGCDVHAAALDRLAAIVRGADTSRPDLPPRGQGARVISQGLRELLRRPRRAEARLIMDDALYRWCRQQSPKH
jgi:hypothetical protein